LLRRISGKKFPDNSSDAYLLLTFDGSSLAEIGNAYSSVATFALRKAPSMYLSWILTKERKRSGPPGAFWSGKGIHHGDG
jgi:glycolate oxidase